MRKTIRMNSAAILEKMIPTSTLAIDASSTMKPPNGLIAIAARPLKIPEIPNSTIVGQFQPETGQQEEFGMLFEKGSDLVPCVNEALAALEGEGTMADIRQRWLSDAVSVPELQ